VKNLLSDLSLLGRLNSLTKFPSIPTLHEMGEKGRLGELAPSFADLDGDDWVVTEKVDGTNCRVMLFVDGSYLVGSREELLWHSEDLIGNPALHILDTVRSTGGFDRALLDLKMSGLVVLYLEVFGSGVGAQHKQYSTAGSRSLRLFDAAFWPGLSWWEMLELRSREDLASYREQGGQPFVSWDDLASMGKTMAVTCVAEREAFVPDSPTHLEVLEYLDAFSRSECRLDEGALGKAEGVVLRSRHGTTGVKGAVRRFKARSEDYQKTLRSKSR
jgi:hypothetical protein